ncbi:hypothetical protein ACU60V_23945, partial [Klebsiella aerogenes]
PQNDVTLKMPAFEWVHVQLHQQKGMISLSPPTICNSAGSFPFSKRPPKSAQISYLFDHDSGAILYFSRGKIKKH